MTYGMQTRQGGELQQVAGGERAVFRYGIEDSELVR